jgi:mRNA interferase MazF
MPLRGEVWWCELPEIQRRPVVVISRDAAIPRLRRTLIAPCTTTIRNLPSEVVLEPGDDPISRRCAVNLDLVESATFVNKGDETKSLGAGDENRTRVLSLGR